MPQAEPNFVLMRDEPTSPTDHLRKRALRLLEAAQERVEEGRPEFPAFASPAPMSKAEAAPARALAIGIVTMPAVFLMIVLGALAIFGKPAAPSAEIATVEPEIAKLEQPVARRPAARATFASVGGFTLGEDEKIAAISLDGDRVALHVESPAGAQIIIYDYRSGEIVSDQKVTIASNEPVDSLAATVGAPQPPSQKPRAEN